MRFKIVDSLLKQFWFVYVLAYICFVVLSLFDFDNNSTEYIDEMINGFHLFCDDSSKID